MILSFSIGLPLRVFASLLFTPSATLCALCVSALKAAAAGQKELAEKNRHLLELYRARQPFHEPAQTSNIEH